MGNVGCGAAGNWREKAYSFFAHVECEAFPCHQTEDSKNFNCLFCFCPLYQLGEDCGGSFTYTPSGIKDCGGCSFPHQREHYGLIAERLRITSPTRVGK